MSGSSKLPEKPPLKISRDLATQKSWQLAPNRYNVTGEVGINKRGDKGSFWSQLKRTPVGGKQTRIRNATAFYEIPRESEKYLRRCLRQKGKFLTDPRKRRPSSRFMVSNLFTCWRNPKDPGPGRYFIGILAQEKFPKLKAKALVPYKFLRYSCVPEKKYSALGKKTSFDPGPGRYELDDAEDALCLALKIEKQKRLKFRRQPIKRGYVGKPKKNLLWRHIFGYGFTRLFRGPPLHPAVVVSKRKARKVDREVSMFHTSEYIHKITQPERTPFTFRPKECKKQPKPLTYNCIVRVIIRRQLRNNKKIAFDSGMPRFPDAEMPTTRKMTKPPPLVDQPVMRVPLSEIKSKLYTVPHRLMGIFKENRIRPFKFQPFPPVKLLLDENQVIPENAETVNIYPSYLNPLDYYKDEYRRD